MIGKGRWHKERLDAFSVELVAYLTGHPRLQTLPDQDFDYVIQKVINDLSERLDVSSWILSKEYLNTIRYCWLAILAGAIVALTGFAMSLNTFCSSSPYALYWLCENYTALVATIAGSLIMIVTAILLSRALFKSRRGVAERSEGNAVSTLTDTEWRTSNRQKTTRTWTLVIIAIVIGSILLTSSAIRAGAWQA